jgi:hypothetical protein
MIWFGDAVFITDSRWGFKNPGEMRNIFKIFLEKLQWEKI